MCFDALQVQKLEDGGCIASSSPFTHCGNTIDSLVQPTHDEPMLALLDNDCCAVAGSWNDLDASWHTKVKPDVVFQDTSFYLNALPSLFADDSTDKLDTVASQIHLLKLWKQLL